MKNSATEKSIHENVYILNEAIQSIETFAKTMRILAQAYNACADALHRAEMELYAMKKEQVTDE